ncbi:MAG: zinc ribbon domain-containing protein [Saprospiraceae bacterium]|nr:zinc ribbon domain-containing protein [Saprospiraceae bacterium]
MTQQQLHCPSCSAPVPAEDINITRMVAKCSQCHTVFSFESEFSATNAPVYSKPEILMPVGIEVLRLLSEVQIEISWRKTSSKFFILFTVIWNAIILPVSIATIISGEWQILLFLSLHFSVGLVLLYVTLTTLLNTTYITVSSRRLVVEHKPLWLPFHPDQDIASFLVKQLYAVKYEQGKTNGRPVYAYSLHVLLKSGQDVKLLKGLKTAEQAQYIEQEIERFLKISDEVVEGEYR